MLYLWGLNHKTARIDMRQRFHVGKEEIPTHLSNLLKISDVREGMILSTCNRVEIVSHIESLQASEKIKNYFCEAKNLNPADVDSLTYSYQDAQAVSHIFRVASSLDSLVVGEAQILGQMKEAFRLAMDAGSTGKVLNRCLHRAFFVAKRVRTETEISRYPVSVGSVAVDLALKIFENLREKVVLLVGAGEMMQEVAMRLVQAGVTDLLVTNRSHAKAVELAQEFQGTTFFLEKLPQHLPRADIVMVCTASEKPLIDLAMVEQAMGHRKHVPMFLIDLSVPRNVDVEITSHPNVFLYDLDHFEAIVEENLNLRKKQMAEAEAIVEEERHLFLEKMDEGQLDPVIRSLYQKADEIAQGELAKTLKTFQNVTPEQRQALEIMTQSIARKMLHGPVEEIKREARSTQDHSSLRSLLSRLFRI